ncbi:MAG: sulfurtransferase TusA family protein [Nitriliruptoraceae bacterium]
MTVPTAGTGVVPDEVHVDVDASGLACPLPVIELARAIADAEPGQVVALTSTDPASHVDVPVWCRMQRQELCATSHDGAAWRFWVRRRV